jgi:alkylhydroperoxidase family enzyme
VTEPRLAPLPRERWDDDVRDALRQGIGNVAAERYLADDNVPVPSVIATLLHNPKLASRFLAYNMELLQRPTIDARLRELMILRVAFRARAPYEWAQHVRMAEALGIRADEIAAIAGADGEWKPLEATLLAATDQLIDNYRIDDDTWQLLAAELDEQQLVELVFVVGTYTALAMAFNSFGLQLDADLQTTSIPFEE